MPLQITSRRDPPRPFPLFSCVSGRIDPTPIPSRLLQGAIQELRKSSAGVSKQQGTPVLHAPLPSKPWDAPE